MDAYIEKRRQYMKDYYMKNKDRYKNGKYVKKKPKPEPKFYIERKPVTIKFRWIFSSHLAWAVGVLVMDCTSSSDSLSEYRRSEIAYLFAYKPLGQHNSHSPSSGPSTLP